MSKKSNLKAVEFMMETQQHISDVRAIMNFISAALFVRGTDHDRSKLEHPEVFGYSQHSYGLASKAFGSPAYELKPAELQEAIDHHYENNRHHPEHHEDGIRGMNLLDLVEMVVDWKAASLLNGDGDFMKSIEISAERFGLSEDLVAILKNTVAVLEGAEKRDCDHG